MALGNHHQVNGRLGRDPEVRILNKETGAKVANLSIATDRFYRDGAGELQKVTDWHRAVLFGSFAARAEKFLNKGKEILLEGYSRTREWTDAQGIKRYTTEIVCENFRMVGAAPASAATPPVDAYSDDPAALGYGNADMATAQAAAGGGPTGDEIPF